MSRWVGQTQWAVGSTRIAWPLQCRYFLSHSPFSDLMLRVITARA